MSRAVLLAALVSGAAATARSASIVFNGPFVAEADGITNVHISFAEPLDGELSLHYGPCNISSRDGAHHRVGTTYVGKHDLAGRNVAWTDNRPSRFVWLPPADVESGGCLHAFSGDALVGSSSAYTIAARKARRRALSSTTAAAPAAKPIVLADIADPLGPWFDGVVYLKAKEPGSVFVAQSKEKEIGIVGAGMSGLMTAYLLDSVGIHNWKIIEASQRLGGRVHTTYLNGTKPEDYQYQEMGPMRFPVSITNTTTNETIQILDHRMVFQLADTLNALNGNDPALSVDFIPWIQNGVNTPRDTTNVTASWSNVTAVEDALAAIGKWDDLTWARANEFATNVFEAHKKAVDDGFFDFSEMGFLRYLLHTDKNITDQAVGTLSNTNIPEWLYENVYFSATTWRTIDKGLTRLPTAFTPLVTNRTQFGTKVEALGYDAKRGKTSVSWRANGPFDRNLTSLEFDYTVVAVPFSKVRLWALPGFTGLLSRAIQEFNYEQACKVALLFKTRFWEHLDKPIHGGCGTTNTTGIGSVCYPSYNLDGKGPGALLASYQSGDIARTLDSMTDDEHVAYVLRAIAAIHGKELVYDQWTGVYDRRCWENDDLQGGAWANPIVGQQEVFLPAYYHTEKNTVFVGEHTSITHAWIFSALESAVRGTTQLLLEMGLVDEAKNVTQTWMARWIHV
ncbi:hypothetical protein EXIGLDRAFT_670834 [Exidia glandulosa HHB12029]|uniref:Amine oxidase domain-containing protein n=1 Tax=Exidia glandulosa HHB12029 TaxID=1314781 RepID=A0A165KR05_EXIGL|nr:hypothetical protein EXIGLDRAFT_670834 [Exidia glandulosa HHB12029]